MVAQPSESQKANLLSNNLQLYLAQSQYWKLRSDSLPMQPSGLMPPDTTQETFDSIMADKVLQFLTLNPGDSQFTAPFLAGHPPGTKSRYHWKPIDNNEPVQTQASCFCWTMAIIKKFWNTAWDLLAHWNIKLPGAGLGLPNSTMKPGLSQSRSSVLVMSLAQVFFSFLIKPPWLDISHSTLVSISWFGPRFCPLIPR